MRELFCGNRSEAVKKLEIAKIRFCKWLITKGRVLHFSAVHQFFHSFSVTAGTSNGVRPSPGAASSGWPPGPATPEVAVHLHKAAPEDGRASSLAQDAFYFSCIPIKRC